MVTFETSFQVRSHGAICSACDSSFTHEFLWNCSHSAMGLDAICNVLTLELHIAIAQNGYEAHSCVTSHTSMHRTQSNRTMWTVSLTTTQSNFCILKIAVAHRTVWTSLKWVEIVVSRRSCQHLDCLLKFDDSTSLGSVSVSVRGAGQAQTDTTSINNTLSLTKLLHLFFL